MSVIESILNARKANINDYKRISRLFSDFGEENKTIKDYNGRQILELLQNADDESSSEVEIYLNSSEHLLRVSNVGTPFSKRGYESLLLPNNSPKSNKKKYIGNKGLGFRSILNWAERIEIISNKCNVQFSREIASKVVEENLSEQLDEIQKEKEERGFKADAFTYPILSLPNVEEDKSESKWTTEIRIHYFKKYEKDIQDQLNFLSEEVLLFVRNIKEITVNENGLIRELKSNRKQENNYTKCEIECSSEDMAKKTIYHVYSKNEEFPEEYQESNDKKEPLFYEISVAVPYDDDFDFSKKENFLYSFFRTDIKVPLPCIIHGTFELDSSRNRCVSDEKNDFIWKQIADLLLHVSKSIQATKSSADWKSYELLALNGSCSYLESYLENFLLEEPLYPCYDDSYRKAADSIFYSDEFNLHVEKKYSKFFPSMLKHYEKPVSRLLLGKFRKYESDSFWSTWNGIALSPEMTFDDRIELICLLEKLQIYMKLKLPLLVDDEGKVIDGKTDVYTPVLQTVPPAVPPFMDVKFLNKEMYNILVSKLEITDANKARSLCDKIGRFINIQEYSISSLTPKIITKCNKLANDTKDPIYIKQTVQALYKNFVKSSRDQSNASAKYESILLVARDRSFVSPTELYFSKTYDVGKVTEAIYGDCLKEGQYLIQKDFWEIEDDEKLEVFFEYLGVEKSIKCIEARIGSSDREYFDSALEKAECEAYKKYHNFPNNNVFQIEKVDSLNKFSSSQILALVLNGNVLCSKLEQKTLISFHSPHYAGQYDAYTDDSYIAYQLRNLFSQVVIDNDYSDIGPLIDDGFKIDYEFLEKNGFSRSRANYILDRLGACNKLDDYSPEALYSLIRKIPEKIPDGKRVSGMYETIFDILKNKEDLNTPDDLILGCRINDKIEYKPSFQIYYFDKTALPQSALRTIPVLLFNKSVSVSKIARIFNVCCSKNGLLSIIEDSVKINSTLTGDFARYFSARKPYILAYRLRTIKGDTKWEKEALKIEKLSIKLVEQGCYDIQGKPSALDQYDFIVNGNVAYVKVPKVHCDTLIQNQSFLDVCCEILGTVFSLESSDMKTIFKNVLRNSIEVSKQDIISEKDEVYLQDCLKILKMNGTDEDAFWNRIFSQKGIDEFDYSLGKNLKAYVAEKLNLELPENYEKIDFTDFKDEESYLFLKRICSDLHIEPNICLNRDGLMPYYRNRLQDLIYDNKKSFKSLLWERLNGLPIENEEERIQFADTIYNYEHHSCNVIDLSSCRFEFDVDLLPFLKSYVEKTYGINLDRENIPLYEEINYYKDIVDEAELDSDERLRRLSIFEGYDKLFAERVEELRRLKREDQESQEGDAEKNEPVPYSYISIAPMSLSDSTESDNGENLGQVLSSHHEERSDADVADNAPKGPSRVPKNINDLKGKAGKAAEKRVKKWLEENNFESDPKSSISGGIDSNDAEHFDFLYKKKNSSEWRFLEVKNFANSTVILTRGEIDFIFKDNHQKKYDLALVKKGKVLPSIAPFEGLDKKSFMKKYGAEPVAYGVSFEIKEKE